MLKRLKSEAFLFSSPSEIENVEFTNTQDDEGGFWGRGVCVQLQDAKTVLQGFECVNMGSGISKFFALVKQV